MSRVERGRKQWEGDEIEREGGRRVEGIYKNRNMNLWSLGAWRINYTSKEVLPLR